MPVISESRTRLWIKGDDLVPEEISRLLEQKPDRTHQKDEVVLTALGRKRTAKTGLWEICADNCRPENLDAQIRDLLAALTQDTAVWREISGRFQISICSSLFLEETMGGFDLSPETIQMLGERGIGLDVDIWGTSDE